MYLSVHIYRKVWSEERTECQFLSADERQSVNDTQEWSRERTRTYKIGYSFTSCVRHHRILQRLLELGLRIGYADAEAELV